ncbi:InvB/SpaK family type III secretion system chaperone [Erwinia psidii]|uniref:Type III secretion system chaperone SpaK n=1 Tax=Erwinia psidii TaxID=69224 RepID=A0A3N6USH0_9GAMM|nr:hypothetical protein [Erwinia psidii]MCX8958716.1 hypothetical protein [Erwinia psidii]MCX8961154.1 hypothetical protein [Erwinia psidii]MCX8966674.1 hypothetical protein [Erwinia psidii]RQM38949.1 hypothetical protein EB241_07115 [Erwinia psidii]
MKLDVVTLLSDMLNEAGLGDIIDNDLSNHSTISLKMKDDIPTINIRTEDDHVWVWATICDYNQSALSYCSDNIFTLMFNFNEDFFYTGQPCLYPIDGNLELRAVIKDKFLFSPSEFVEVLDQYLNILQEYRQVLL